MCTLFDPAPAAAAPPPYPKKGAIEAKDCPVSPEDFFILKRILRVLNSDKDKETSGL